MSILSPSAITLIVLALSCILFVSGRIRSDIVALGSLLLLLLTGVLTPAEALSGFSSTVVIMMVGLFVVGAGIFRTGLAKMISGKIMKVGGSNENVLFLLVMLVTSAIGAFVSNTGTVAVMMPIVMSMASASGISARRYLMPMAFASSMGLFTLISTPPNLVIQDAIVAEGLEPLGFFSFAPVGAVAVLVGVGVLFFLSRLLVVRDGDRPQGGKRKGKSPAEIVKEYNLAHQSFKVLIPEDSALVGRTLHQLRIGSEYDLSVGRIVHPPQRKFSRVTTEEVAGPESVIRAGDTLIMYGSEENAMRFVKENALGADVEPGTLLGCVINPMQQSEPSKVGIFMNADFSWNNWTSYDHADRAWRDAFSHVDNGSPVATDASDALRDELNIPAMAVLQFAFGDTPDNPYLPHNIKKECVYYTGTHDNNTSIGWYENAPEKQKDMFRRYFRTSGDSPNWEMIHAVMMSVAKIAIFPMQDIAGLGAECRTNTPGVPYGNWQWRLTRGLLERVERVNVPYLREIVELSGRLREPENKKCVEI